VTAAATAYNEGENKLIKRIEIVANGRDTIKSIDGPALNRLNQILMGSANEASAVPTAVGSSQAMNSTVVLDFAMPRAIKPIDTLLNAFKFSTLELRITWGSEKDVYSANSANVTIDSASISVHSIESIGNQGGMINKAFTAEKEVTATSSEFQFALPVGNMYRGMLIHSEVDGNPNNSVINSLELRSGTDVHRKWDWPALQDHNKIEYALESMPSGYAFVDFAPDGYLSEALATAQMSNLDFIFNVTKQTGTNKIRVYPVELIPVA